MICLRSLSIFPFNCLVTRVLAALSIVFWDNQEALLADRSVTRRVSTPLSISSLYLLRSHDEHLVRSDVL